MKKPSILPWFGIAAACAACCAPLWLPFVAGAGAAGITVLTGRGLFGLSMDVIICGAALAVIIAGVGFWLTRRDKVSVCACKDACKTDGCEHDEQAKR